MLQSARIGMTQNQHHQHQQKPGKRREEDYRRRLPKPHHAANGKEHLDVSATGRMKDKRQKEKKSADKATPYSRHERLHTTVTESPRKGEQCAPKRQPIRQTAVTTVLIGQDRQPDYHSDWEKPIHLF